ncbi:TlpA family protein disulfide reductase [Paenibacillus turpanensis]|uniref:TlpA family protein disulfide reductase n=1 Tax=Paenibacillus turpanensis TaxID=2689078 RepID=UPI00140884F4|nr:TlpA disulfide reductase family protein [Paenibacillus turpanensis]
MKRNSLIIFTVAVLTGLALLQSFVWAKPKEELPKKNFLAPSFQLVGMDGQNIQVGGPKDKPYLINFWASWCDPCHMEAPDFVKVYEQYKDQVEIYAVNARSVDKAEEAADFAKQYGFNFPVPVDKDGDVMKLYQVYGFPTTYFVDRNGIIRDIALGMIQGEELEKKVKQLID